MVYHNITNTNEPQDLIPYFDDNEYYDDGDEYDSDEEEDEEEDDDDFATTLSYNKLRPVRRVMKHKGYSQSDLINAYKLVKETGFPVKTAARQFGVPHNTLRDRVKGRIYPETSTTGPGPVFTLEEETKLVNHIKRMADLGYKFTITDIVSKASDYAVYLEKRTPDKPLSVKWYKGLSNRWPDLRATKPKRLSKCRAASTTEETVDAYFMYMETALKENDQDKLVQTIMPKSKEFISSESDTDSEVQTIMPKSKEFISSESDTDSEPKPKKKKTGKKEERKPEKKESPKKSSGGAEKGPGGEMTFQLAKMRYATVSEISGKIMVGIKEYYEKDGEMRPGKKGISLPMDQWKRLIEQIDDINEAVKDLS